MNEKKLVHSFKSYLDLSPKNNGEKNGSAQELKPKLLKGELVVGAAHSVVMLNPLCERDKGLFGSLFVTNYRLSFVPAMELSADERVLRNLLLGPHDVPLTAVASVWLLDKSRRRRLKPYGDMPSTVRGLRLVCKNMKVLQFDFGRCPIGSGRKVTISLLHHAFPKRHDLLFAYEYREPYYPTLPSDLNMFYRPNDWKRELERCECPHWRITCINGTSDAFMLTAGETLIVPNSVLDFNLMETARHFRSGRVPVWVWGRAEGGALLRSGELLHTDTSNTAESVYLEQVRRSHPKLTPPHVIYLCGNSFTNAGNNSSVLPSLLTLQSSHKKILELCTPSSLQEFWTQDSQYYSVLDSSRWLRYVASCLAFADEASEHLANNVTVLLQEGDGVDYCAVVSCLTQMLLDPHFRSISGFQSLIQKEWIALGHPFCDRFGLPRPGGAHTNESPSAQVAPVFSLFLDCVWQLTEQFPTSFQFTQNYLTALSDCLHNQLFDTFLFNSPRDRELAVAKSLIQRPVWDWGEQFSEEHKAFFYNPLYAASKYTSTLPQRFCPTPVSKSNETRLEPCTSVAGVELWSQRYERWLLPLDVLHAGPVQHQLINQVLVKQVIAHYIHPAPDQHRRVLRRPQIQQLSERLTSLSILNNRRSIDVDLEAAQIPVVSRFYPFTLGRNDNTTSVLTSMPADLVDASHVVDRMSLLNAPD